VLLFLCLFVLFAFTNIYIFIFIHRKR